MNSKSIQASSIQGSRLWLPLAAVVLAGCVSAPSVPPPAPFGATPSPRQLKQHTDREFYAFCHFTVDTFTDREWGTGGESETVFNPTDFDADQIVGAVKAAGMKGFILTCKHHDGFCLWPTKTTEHSVKNSPFRGGRGDVVKEIEQACRRAGLEFAVYLSPWDRNHPEYGRPAYLQVYRAQLAELLTNYGPLFEIWLDGANGGDGYYGGLVGPAERTGKMEMRRIDRLSYYDWPTTWALMHQLQPDALIFSDVGPDIRWCGNERGYAPPNIRATITYAADEIPGQCGEKKLNVGTLHGASYVPAEVNVSIRPGWFWHASQDSRVRSPENLMNIYMNSVGYGQTFLLNVTPDRRGRVPENDVESLRQLGEHLRQTFGTNLAAGARVAASNIRGDCSAYGPAKLLDGDKWSAWTTDDAVTTPEVVFELPAPRTFNLVRVREDLRLGLRVEGIAFDAWVDGAWKELATAEAVGACRLWRLPETTTDRVRVRVTKAPVCPALSDFGLFLEPKFADWVPPVGGKPAAIPKGKWKAVGEGSPQAVDGNPATVWRSPAGLPQELVVDMGEARAINGFTYLPPQGTADGVVDRYEFLVSADGASWRSLNAGEFGNIRANPVEQTVLFKPATARYLKFVAKRTLSQDYAAVAELGVLEAK